MKNKYIYIATLVSSLFMTTSCDSLLDTETLSTDNVEYLCSNPTDTRKMIAGVYRYFCEDTYTSRMSTNWMQNTDVEFAGLSASQAVGSDRRGVWALNPSYFSDIKNCWDNSYKAIDFANQCIAGIEASDMYKSGNTDMKQMNGEAYCLRSYFYWLLINFWGDVPYATEPTSALNTNNTGRVDKNIIYSRCIQDLIDHEGEMQWSTKMSTEYMNRDFALGFIAKLAMFRAGYSMQKDGTMARYAGNIQEGYTAEDYTVTYTDENGVACTAVTADDYYKVAQTYARKLITLKGRSLATNFKGIFDKQINDCSDADSDVLFEMGFVPNSGGDIGWCLGLSVVDSSKGAGSTYTNLTPSYAGSFDAQDQRRNATCANYRYLYDDRQNAMDGWGVQPAKWCRIDLNTTSVASKGTGINWPILRYADVLLLLAEADNEVNGAPTDEAKQLLKQVRERAFVNASNKAEMVNNYVNALTDHDAFRQAIINERAWEFGGECIRKFDLIRWNYYSDAIANTISWMVKTSMNAQQLEWDGSSMLYNKDKEIANGIAARLYYKITNGVVNFQNDYLTNMDKSVSPYKEAATMKDADVTSKYTSDNLYYVAFGEAFISVSTTDPTTNTAYGTDANGNDIKKGTINEKVAASFYGLTDGNLTDGDFDFNYLRTKVTPYVFPIPTDRISSSNGKLSNEGYAIRNK